MFESGEVMSAKLSQLVKLQQFDTYEEVLDSVQRTLSTRSVVTNKNGKTKARLAAREFEERDLEISRDKFRAGKVEEKVLKYIGLQVHQERNMIKLDHSNYTESMKTCILDLERALQKEEQLSVEEQTQFRQIIGQLNWAVQGSRTDMAFEMIIMSIMMMLVDYLWCK